MGPLPEPLQAMLDLARAWGDEEWVPSDVREIARALDRWDGDLDYIQTVSADVALDLLIAAPVADVHDPAWDLLLAWREVAAPVREMEAALEAHEGDDELDELRARVRRLEASAVHPLALAVFDVLRDLDAGVLKVFYGINVDAPAPVPLHVAIAAWWQAGRP